MAWQIVGTRACFGSCRDDVGATFGITPSQYMDWLTFLHLNDEYGPTYPEHAPKDLVLSENLQNNCIINSYWHKTKVRNPVFDFVTVAYFRQRLFQYFFWPA